MISRVAAVVGPLAAYVAGFSILSFVIGLCMVPGAVQDRGPVRDTGESLRLLSAAIGIGDAPMMAHVLMWIGIGGVLLAISMRVRYDKMTGCNGE